MTQSEYRRFMLMHPRTLILTLSLVGVLSSTGCVIVVNDQQADAEWIGS